MLCELTGRIEGTLTLGTAVMNRLKMIVQIIVSVKI